MSGVPARTPQPQTGWDRTLLFPSGLYGFRQARRFAVLPVEGAGDAFHVLQSLDQPALSFLLAAPEFFFPTYRPEADAADLQEVELQDPSTGIWMLLVTVPEGHAREATANLRAPLLINPFARLGKQVILREDYPVRHPLFRP